MEEKEVLNKLKYLIKKKKTLDEIQEELGMKNYEVFGLIELLKQQGWQTEFRDDKFIYIKEQILKEADVYHLPPTNKHKLLFLSDTHLGSKYDRLDLLRYLYDLAEKEEIDTVFHVGDLVDGNYPNRPNHEYELKAHGIEEQVEYVIKNYPCREGIHTYFINGNHDYTGVRNAGFDTGKAIAKERKDMIYLGQDVADATYGKVRLRLFHGSRGQSYARSYRLQKYVEQIPSYEKPHILLMGHYHTSFYMKYSDVHCFQVPSLLDQTPFARSLGLGNEKGAWLVDFTTDKYGNIITITPELIDFSVQGKKLTRGRK